VHLEHCCLRKPPSPQAQCALPVAQQTRHSQDVHAHQNVRVRRRPAPAPPQSPSARPRLAGRRPRTPAAHTRNSAERAGSDGDLYRKATRAAPCQCRMTRLVAACAQLSPARARAPARAWPRARRAGPHAPHSLQQVRGGAVARGAAARPTPPALHAAGRRAVPSERQYGQPPKPPAGVYGAAGKGGAPSAGTSLAWSSPVTFVVTWFMRTTCAGAQPGRQRRPAGAHVPSRRLGLQQLLLLSEQRLPHARWWMLTTAHCSWTAVHAVIKQVPVQRHALTCCGGPPLKAHGPVDLSDDAHLAMPGHIGCRAARLTATHSHQAHSRTLDSPLA
jgi:hypothetical protein